MLCNFTDVFIVKQQYYTLTKVENTKMHNWSTTKVHLWIQFYWRCSCKHSFCEDLCLYSL